VKFFLTYPNPTKGRRGKNTESSEEIYKA